MINIEERPTEKVPGITSFFVTFDYNVDIFNAMKTLTCKNYVKPKNRWEVPITGLRELIDTLSILDDLKITFMKQEQAAEQREIGITSEFKTKPFPYQLEGIKYGLNHKKWLLLDDMGLGKSLQAIYLAQELAKTRGLKHCLVICGINSLKTNWLKEIKKHSDMSAMILGQYYNRKGKLKIGSVKDRINQLNNNIEEFFMITNIETLRNDDIVDSIINGPNQIDMIVVDEAHKCKNSESEQGANLLKLDSEYKLAMSGTLMMNNPLDVYVPLQWIDMDRSTLTNYKSNYCRMVGEKNNILAGFKNLDLIKEQLALCSLRRLKKNELKDLPPKTLIPEYLDMEDKQAKFYSDIEEGIIEEVDKVKMTTTSLLAMVTRLRQATACPNVLTSSDIGSVKLDRAKELVEEIVEKDSKVIIFSTFKESVYKLKEMLSEYDPIIATGDSSDQEMSDAQDTFQSDPTKKVFIGTWQKSGTGLTLTAASYMIFIDTPWTDAAFQQACDRIHRIGAVNPVFIYVLICNDTIDERVFEILNDKRALSEYVIDDIITQSGLDSLKKYLDDLK